MLVPKDNSKFRNIFCPVRAPSTMPYECIESRSTNRRGMMYGCGDRVMYNVGMSSWVPSTVSISNSTTLVLHYSSTTSTTSTTTSPIHCAHLRDHQCSQPSPADQACSGKRKLALKLKNLTSFVDVDMEHTQNQIRLIGLCF